MDMYYIYGVWYNSKGKEGGNMLLRQMKYFVSVVKNNSFTKAAEECYISQSAISQGIKALEDELGVKLLERKNRGFSLTKAGEYFYRQSLVLLDEAEKIKQETIKIAKGNNNTLNVGIINSYLDFKIHNVVAEFMSYHKDINVEITTGNHEKLYDLLREGKLDIILNDQRRALSDEYVNYYLFSKYLYIEISDGNSINNLEEVTLNELTKIPCILIASKDQEENEKEYYQKTLGFSGNFIFARNLEEGRILVAGNKGFMPVEKDSNSENTSEKIKNIPLVRNGKQIERKYYAFWKREASNIYMEEFAKILRDMLGNS